jgi:hypothetical protein
LVSLGSGSPSGLLVQPETAVNQIEAETPLPAGIGSAGTSPSIGRKGDEPSQEPAPKKQPTRFHGSVPLDPSRVGRDAGRIADEVLSHLSGLVGSNVKVTLEIEASVPGGVSDDTVRVVTENARTLKFASQGFETE